MSSSKSIFPKPPIGVLEKRLESRFPSMSSIEISWVGESGNIVRHSANVIDSSGNGLGLKTHTRFPTGRMIWMRDIHGDLVRAVVRFSRNHEQGDWQTGVRLVNRDKRKVGRDPVRGAAELKWVDPGGRTASMVVSVVDISEAGAGVVAPRSLAVGLFVQLIGDQFECFCSVRNARDNGDGTVRIGMQFAHEPRDRARSVTADWID